MVAPQRLRMLRAMAEAVAAKGYARTSVADVLGRAGVSRETFYEQFSSKEDCFLATFDKAAEVLLGQLTDVAGQAAAGDRFERLVGAYLDAIAGKPAYARIYLVEAHAVGPEAVRRSAAIQGRFTGALAELLDAQGPARALRLRGSRGGVGAMVSTRLALGEHQCLRDLREPIVDLVRRARRSSR